MAEPARSRRIVDQGGSLLGIGIQLVVTILAFAALGWWLDQKFDTQPWLLLAGLIFGATGGMISFIRTALRAGRSSSKGGRGGHPPSQETISRDE